MSKRYAVQDLDGRPWIGEGTFGVRLNQKAIPNLSAIPDPLTGDDGTSFAHEDQKGIRFDSRSQGNESVTIIKAVAPTKAGEQIPYELLFYRNGTLFNRVPPRQFSARPDGISGLSLPLIVPWRRPHAIHHYLMFAAFLLVVTFGIYRPFYQWRLSKGANVDQSRDLAAFLWWLFALLGYAVFLYLFFPRGILDWALLGLLGVVVLFRLFLALRSHEEPAPAMA
ncbi:MAG: hypothetical protein KBD56_00945 [Candidatus Eisenbacteria bacterium]|nr:hypothetical protein [Candidatus Eisenbacteria bacterium]